MNPYQLIQEKYIDEINSNARMFKHIKSGARVLTISNDDDNKVFDITFRTPPENDTGVPHILEHSTLCGSKKFPVKDPFVELLKSSLNTFLNAMTSPDKTSYPIASCNEKDFMNLMEVYMDAVFYPNVYTHEEIFKQEGWHYELDDINNDIKINGVVYNEMKGAFSNPEQVVYRLSRHMMYPDTTYGVESGGDPEFIPELSYEQFKAFHSRYYSPANSYIFLYGNMDMEEKLKWLDDNYLSKFDIVETNSEIKFQKPFKETMYQKAYYPIGKDDEINNKTYYSYNWVLGDYANTKLSYAFAILDYVLLSSPGAPLKQALIDANLGKDIMSSYDESLLQPCLCIIAKDCAENNEKEFEKIIRETLEKQVKNGIDKKSLLAAININEFKLREADYGGLPKGLIYVFNALDTWLYDENRPLDKIGYSKIFKELKEDVEKGYFESLINDYLLNNKHAGLLTMSPSKTIAQEREDKLKAKLDAFKKSLSKADLEKMVEDTKALKKYQETPSTKEELATIPYLTRSDIELDECQLHNDVKNIGGIECVEHNINTNDINYLTMMFKADKINPEHIPYLGLLVDIFGNIDTNKHTYQDLVKDININSGGISFDFMCMSNNKSESLPFITADASYLHGNEKFSFDTILEIIKESKLSDKKRIKEIVNEDISGLYMRISNRGNAAASTRALSYINKTMSYRDKTGGIEQYNFLKDLEKNFDEKIEETIKIFNELIENIFRKENLIISFTGQEFEYHNYINDFVDALFKNEIKTYQYDFVPVKKNEGFKTASQIQYVAKVGSFDKEKYSGAVLAFNQALRFDYLWVKVRVLGGAYGVASSTFKNGFITFTSYRDPNLSKTLEVYDNVPNYIDELNPSEDDLTKFVIGAIGNLDAPLTPRDDGNKSMSCYLQGISEEDLRKEREQVTNVTLEDIKKLKEIFIEALSQNNICVIGNESKIEEEKQFFMNIQSL